MKKLTISLTLLFFLLTSAFENVTLPAIIGSNMVLQQDSEVKIWGWAEPGEKVKVEFLDQKIKIKTNDSGEWMVKINTPQASLDSYTMIIEGRNRIELDDILIGEVWVCSGQSNMEWPVSKSLNAQEEIENADMSTIRLFDIEREMAVEAKDNLKGEQWKVCNSENISDFSAVGYFFGRKLHKDLKVPIGLISTNWGGTNVETWMSQNAIDKHTFLDKQYKKLVNHIHRFDDIEKAIEQLNKNKYPTLLFNGMVSPILNFRIKGAIWYQGEANAKSFDRALQYAELFPIMINDWRENWDIGNFPFIYVQLANFRKTDSIPTDDPWPFLRESQLKTLSVKNTAMASAIDIGVGNDIHPRNKQDVGYRLALGALYLAYGRDIEYMGPVYQHHNINKDTAFVTFNHVGSGLSVHDKYGYLKGFTVAGEDEKFHYAKAELINETTVKVYSDEVDDIKALRYGWANNPVEANLYNKEGLPASPFRTDTWSPKKR